jgi:predicted nucleic acid-binding protein
MTFLRRSRILNDQIIVADTGPLIAFARINLFNLLSTLFGSVLIPAEVAQECLADISLPGAHEIQKLIDTAQLQIHKAVDTHSYSSLYDILDSGEISAIALALQLQSRLLIDEKLGREAAKIRSEGYWYSRRIIACKAKKTNYWRIATYR